MNLLRFPTSPAIRGTFAVFAIGLGDERVPNATSTWVHSEVREVSRITLPLGKRFTTRWILGAENRSLRMTSNSHGFSFSKLTETLEYHSLAPHLSYIYGIFHEINPPAMGGPPIAKSQVAPWWQPFGPSFCRSPLWLCWRAWR